MRLFVYVVLYDIGFAPNPFFGSCSLATCKPGIRGTAQVGDWVAGIGSVQKGQEGKLVYAMRVEEATSFDNYWEDARFRRKRPNRSGSLMQRYGDNIYHRTPGTEDWIQEDGRHSLEDGSPNLDHIQRDTSRPRVLISQTFVYFGAAAAIIPEQFRSWDGIDYFASVRSYRCKFPNDIQGAFIAWLEELCATVAGLAGEPLDWAGLLGS